MVGNREWEWIIASLGKRESVAVTSVASNLNKAMAEQELAMVAMTLI